MTEKVLNKVNNDIFSYDTTDNAFKMSRVKPTEIHHASTGTGTSGQLLTSTGTAWEWSDAPSAAARHPGEPYKIHTLPTAAYQTSANGTTAPAGETDIFTDTFTKTAGTELYIEWHGYAFISGSGTDEFALHLEIEDSTNSALFKNTGHYYNSHWKEYGNATSGTGHRSLGGSQAALSSKEIDVNNTNDTDAPTNENYGGTVSIKLVFTKDTTGVTTDNFNDVVYFKTGFFKIFEIWAIGTPYTPSASSITTTSGEVIISDALRINNELNLGNNNPGAAGEVLVSAGPGNLPTWGVGAAGSVSMDQIFKVHMFEVEPVVFSTSGAGYHTVYTNTFTKTAGTHLYAEAHFEAVVGGWGNDQISTGLIIFDGAVVAAPGTPTFQVTGKDYHTTWRGGGQGGGHRSLGSSQPALSTKAPAGSNDTTVATNLNFSGDLTIRFHWYKNPSLFNDGVDFNHGYIKIFEIWAAGTPYTPSTSITESSTEVIIDTALQINNELNLGTNNPGTSGQVLVSAGAGNLPTWAGTNFLYKLIPNTNNSASIVSIINTDFTAENEWWYQYKDGDLYNDGPDITNATGSYFGAVVAPNKKIYLIPFTRSQVGIYDPYNNSFSLGAALPAGIATGGFWGGVLDPYGRIVYVPYNSLNVVVYIPSINKHITTAARSGTTGGQFAGGVLAPNGKIIFAPYNSPVVGIYDPSNDTYASGAAHGQGVTKAFVGAVLAPDGRVIFVPRDSQRVGIYDPITDTFDSNGPLHNQGSGAFFGGVLAPNGQIVFVPLNSSNICIFDPTTNGCSVRLAHGQSVYAFNGGALAANGKIIMSPSQSPAVGIYDIVTNTFQLSNNHNKGQYAYRGAILGPYGKVILIPDGSADIGIYGLDNSILNDRFETNIKLPYFNKF